MQAPRRRTGTLVALFAAAAGAGMLVPERRSSATTCSINSTILTFLEATEDGVALSDRSVYQRATAYLRGQGPGELEVTVHAGNTMAWQETYRAVAGAR